MPTTSRSSGNPFLVGSWRFGTSRPWKSTVFQGCMQRFFWVTRHSIILCRRNRACTTVSSSCDRSWVGGKDVHSTKTRPPYLSGEEDARGSSPPIRSHLAGSSEGLMPERIRSDLAHVGPGWSGAHEQRGTRMKHVRIATYEIKKGSFQELADVARDEMLREFRNQPGFIRYGLADSGDKTCVSLSLWETRKDADAATRISETWDREHIADRAELFMNQVGDIAFYEG